MSRTAAVIVGTLERIGFTIGCLVSVLLLAQGAHAAPITFTNTLVDPGGDPLNDPSPNAVFGSDSATLSGDFGLGGFEALAQASSEFGVLSAFASTTLTAYQPQSFNVSIGPNTIQGGGGPVSATAGFLDTFTIQGGVGDGVLDSAF